MLDAQISLTYSDDGVAVATAKTFDKRAHESDVAIYRKTAVINDPSLPDHRITLTTTEAKATSTFYGTRRAIFNVRLEKSVPVPGGTELKPIVFKIESSIPVGVSTPDIEGVVACVRALVAHDIFKRAVKTLETQFPLNLDYPIAIG